MIKEQNIHRLDTHGGCFIFGGDLGGRKQEEHLRAKKQGFFVRKTPVFGDPYGNTSGEGAPTPFPGLLRPRAIASQWGEPMGLLPRMGIPNKKPNRQKSARSLW